MMNTTRFTRRAAWRLLLVPALLALTPPARAQQQENARMGQQMRNGIWPTDKMIENFIHRGTLELSEKYNLREDQRQYLEQSSRARWPQFLAENRDKLQPLINGYFERQTSPTPPTPEEMQEWATNAREVLGAFQDEMHEQQMDFREILEPEQKQTFDKEMAQFQIGMQAVDARFKNWEDGYFHPNDIHWKAPTQAMKAQVEAMPKPTPPGDGGEEGQEASAPPIDMWFAYFKSFDEKYDLDDGQYNRGLAIYMDYQKRASGHRTRKQSDYARLERVPPESRDADWQHKMDELNAPLDEMFKEFNERLFGLLTTAQREMGNSK